MHRRHLLQSFTALAMGTGFGLFTTATAAPAGHPRRVLQPDSAGIPKSCIIDIGSLTPLSYAGKPARQKDFKLRLHIEVAQ